LKDRVFVAHNVNFDYSFVKHHLQQAGYELDTAKLCTIRLTRKIFPGLPKYGLEALSREFNLTNNNRHRAAGDAEATTRLFEILIKNDTSGELKKMMTRRTVDQYIPPNLATEKIKDLPYGPGVYYFHNTKGKVIYVGKAKNLKKRVTSHFSNNKPSKQKQEFLRNIFDITYQVCGSELMAAIFESVEIKRLWPVYNKSQKFYERSFGIFLFEDAKGYLRLGIDNKRKYLKPLASFHMMADAHRTLWKLVNEFELHPALCYLDKSDKRLKGLPDVDEYNQRLRQAVESIKAEQKTYIIRDNASNYILMEEGKFYGMGTIETEILAADKEEIKSLLTPYPENEVLHSMIRTYAERYPAQVIEL
jgi:DNA polymerase-3 subunit epsilon